MKTTVETTGMSPLPIEVTGLQIRVVDEREPAELDAEDDDEQEAGEECRKGKEHVRAGRREVVEEGVSTHGRDETDRDAEGDADDVGDADDGEGVGQPLRDELDHRRVTHERGPEVAGEHSLHPEDVADVPGLVESEGVADVLAGLGRDPGIGSELREWVDRCERE